MSNQRKQNFNVEHSYTFVFPNLLFVINFDKVEVYSIGFQSWWFRGLKFEKNTTDWGVLENKPVVFTPIFSEIEMLYSLGDHKMWCSQGNT